MGDKFEYGVKIENKFAIIDDDDDGLNDPYDLLKKLNVTSQQQPTSKSAAQPTSGKDGKSSKLYDKKQPVAAPTAVSVPSKKNTNTTPKNVMSSTVGGPPPSRGGVGGPGGGMPRKPAPSLPPRFNKEPPSGVIVDDASKIIDQTAPISNNANFAPNFEGKSQQRFYVRGGGGGYRGSRGGGFSRGGRQDGGRGRQFERQSGSDKTGVKAMDKREGGGAYNWGTANDELIGESENTGGSGIGGFAADEMIGGPVAAENGTANGAVNNDEVGEEKGESQVNGETDEKQEELEVQQFTLDEWKKLHGERNKPEFNVRRPGEGENEKPEWKKLVPLKGQPQTKKQKKRKEDVVQVVETARDDEEDERHRKLQNVIEIDIRFADVPSRGARRGGFANRGRTNDGSIAVGAGNTTGFGGFGRGGGGGYNVERRRGGAGQNAGGYKRDRDVPFKMDEQTFPTLA